MLEQRPARVLLAAHDGVIEALRSDRARIETRVSLALASEPALEVAVSKPRTLAVARTLGIPVPRGAEAVDSTDVAAALAEVGLPAIVKPTRSWVSRGGDGSRVGPRAVVTPEEARREVARLTSMGGGAVIQEWIRGPREAVSLVRAGGRVHARFAQVALRTAPSLGGNSVVRESIALPPDTAAAAEQLLGAVGLEGYAEVEFRRDTSGRAVLMEINPRLSASVEVAVRAGVPFPLLVWRWAAGEIVPVVNRYRVGVRMRWLGGDIGRLIESARERGRPEVTPFGSASARFLADFFRPSAYDYLARDDPWPAATAAASLAAYYARRAFASRRKGGMRD